MNYQSAKIYRIECGKYYYYGSTITSLSQRLAVHVSNMKKGDTRKLYNKMRENEYSIHLVMDYPCNNKKELCMKENEFINKADEYCLNTICSYQTQEDRKASQKLRRQQNKEIINVKQREYRKNMNPEIKERQRLQKKEYDYNKYHSSTSSIQNPSS